jgi:hypothetical protein
VPGFSYSRLTLQGFILFNTGLTLYGELKYLCAIVYDFLAEISQPRRKATAV